MNYLKLMLSVTVIAAGAFFTACESSEGKVEKAENKLQDAKDNVVVARQELSQAMKDSIIEFRKESQEAISANEVKIAEFKVKIAKQKKENRAAYERKLAELEQQNNEMKARLAEFNEDQRENWVSVRMKMKQDMDNFGNAMKNFWTGK